MGPTSSYSPGLFSYPSPHYELSMRERLMNNNILNNILNNIIKHSIRANQQLHKQPYLTGRILLFR